MTPLVKKFLIASVAVWLVEVISVVWLETNVLIDHLALVPARVFPGLELWQPLTYMWLHAPTDPFHLLVNGLFLWMCGGALELAWGSKAFLRFYLICGVGAGIIVFLAGLAFAPSVPVLGASGAVYGLVAAWGLVYPNRVIYFFGIFPLKGKHFAMILIGFALVDFLLRAQGVSHAAHLGGMAIGALLVTGYWRPNKARQRLRYWWLRRKLKVVEGERKDPVDGPPGGGYWH